MVVRQDFVPWISFHAEFEVAVPDLSGNTVPNFRGWHMVIKFIATRDGLSQRGEELAWAFEDFGDGIDESFVITRLMPFDWWKDRRHDVRRATLLREKNLNAFACGLRCLDKNKSVFVRNDHGAVLPAICRTTGPWPPVLAQFVNAP